MAKFKRPQDEPQDKMDVDSEVAELEALIQEAAKTYAGADRNEKAAKKVKDAAKTTFNDLATRLVELTRPLARRTVVCSPEDLAHGFGVEEWVKQEYPGYRVRDMELDENSGEVTLVLEEDPALQKYHVVVGDQVVGRTNSDAAETFDAEGYRAHWLNEGDEATADLLVKQTITYELDEAAAERFLAENREERATMASFTTPGAVTTKMTPVRKANEDD